MTPPEIDGRTFGCYDRVLDLDSWEVSNLLASDDIFASNVIDKHFLMCLDIDIDLESSDAMKEAKRLKKIEEGLARKRKALCNQHLQEQKKRIHSNLQDNVSYGGKIEGNKIIFYLRLNEDFIKRILKKYRRSMDIQDIYRFARMYGRNPISVGQAFYRLRNSGEIKQKQGTGENIKCYLK